MTSEQLAMLADTRLPGDARVIGLYLLERGEEWSDASHSDLASLLGGASGETIRRHVRKLEATGWVEVDTDTGSKPSRYRIRSPDETPGGHLRSALAGTLPHISVDPHRFEGETDDSPPQIRGGETLSPTDVDKAPPQMGGGEPPRSSRREVVVGDGDEVPPSVSPPAEQAIEENAELLEGCRTILRGYLSHRVPTDRQQWFVQTLVGWLQGIDPSAWKLSDGSSLPQEERTGYLRSAMSELLSGDETIMKRPVGDPGNLKTKMSIILRQRGTNGTRDSGSRRKSPRGIGRNQPEHVVE